MKYLYNYDVAKITKALTKAAKMNKEEAGKLVTWIDDQLDTQTGKTYTVSIPNDVKGLGIVVVDVKFSRYNDVYALDSVTATVQF